MTADMFVSLWLLHNEILETQRSLYSGDTIFVKRGHQPLVFFVALVM